MKKVYYSESTDKYYDTLDECLAAEEEYDKVNAEKKALEDAIAEWTSKVAEAKAKLKSAEKSLEEAQAKYDEAYKTTEDWNDWNKFISDVFEAFFGHPAE